jgi:hypothetical protein
MNTRNTLFAFGLAVLLAASLFSYSRTETIIRPPDATTTLRWSADGASFVTIVFGVAVFLVGRRISRAVGVASQRVGLPQALSIPVASSFIIATAALFLPFGWSRGSSHDSVQITFGFGDSPWKLPAFLLAVLLVWLVALLQRFRAISERFAQQSHSNATGNA